MAALLKDKYADSLEDVELLPSSGGVFEVTVDGNLVYSKRETGRFPDGKQVTDAIDALA